MKECFFWVGASINIAVGVIGICLAFAVAFDYAMGKLGRYLKSYQVLFEYAFYRREFMQWREEMKGRK